MDKRKIGFAVMNPDALREICSKAGKISHAKGKAHKWTKEEAREAGKKGGKASQEKRNSQLA